jgi:hypothetical protein
MPTSPDEIVGVVESQMRSVPSVLQSCPLVSVETVPTRFHDTCADAVPLIRAAQQTTARPLPMP